MILLIFFVGIPVYLFFVGLHLNKTDDKVNSFENRLNDIEKKIK